MKKIIVLLGLIFFVSFAYGQKDTVIPLPNDTAHHAEVEAKQDTVPWRKHLERSLQMVVFKAADKGLRPGTYNVNVRFIVEKDGSVTDVKALNDIGYGIAATVEKIVQAGPKWIPGTIDGQPVRSYHTQQVIFQIR